ncbi:MAG: hypothetical protein ACMG57_00995 [Candidatus Dojkabacteria bacterium]
MNYLQDTIPDPLLATTQRLEKVANSIPMKQKNLYEPDATALDRNLRLAIAKAAENGIITHIDEEFYLNRLRMVTCKRELKELVGEFTGITNIDEMSTGMLVRALDGVEM